MWLVVRRNQHQRVIRAVGVSWLLKNVLAKMVVMRDNRVDSILHELAILHSNVGTDSTREELDIIYNKENYLRRKIAEIDPELEERLFP